MRGQAIRAGRLFVIALGALLGVLHVAVLARRVVEGTLWEPLVIAQWLVAIGLVGLAIGLRRRGVSVFQGRPAAAFWIVIALMHGMVALPGAPGFVGVVPAIPVTDAAPVGAGLLAGALALLAAFFTARSALNFGFLELLVSAPARPLWLRTPLSIPARAPPA